MPSHTLIIVESPAKARTLKKILGQRYVVKASMGHVRDLPKSRMGVDIDKDFKPEYILVRGKGKIVKELREASSKADRMLIASDPDREGEAIAWHLAELLNIDSDAPCRIRMYEITAKEVKEAVKNPQAIDMDKVYAQQARRLLDRLVGYSLSPLLWSKVRSGLSAGRVQSVALRLICEREAEIEAFRPEEYWLLDVEATSDDGRSYLLRLEKKDGKALAVKSESEAEEIEKNLKGLTLVVRSFTSKEGRRSPLPPFKTSTLQQEAARRLGFSPQRTMRVAQSLYEGVDIKGRGSLGLITYMRTDSLRVAAEAIESVRGYIGAAFGDKYLPQKPHYYASKGRTQDAHEAIRPTDVALAPESVKEDLTRDQFKLYDLIWRRFVASQMAPSAIARSSIVVEAGPYSLKQSGATLLFEGWGALWPLDLKEDEVPPAKEGELLRQGDVHKEQRFTKPPARYSDSSLVKVLEEKGIGRPSTYAVIVQTLYDRDYVAKSDDKKLVPTELGRVVNDFLVRHFPDVVDVSFTAQMEEQLDQVEGGNVEWLKVIKDFWSRFSKVLSEVKRAAESVSLPDRAVGEACPQCGAPLVVKRGRYGEFVACSAYPECTYTRPILQEIGVSCPICGDGKVVRRKSKKGRTFYGCSRYPNCKFTSWDPPTDERCPACGGYMVLKGRSKTPTCSSCGHKGLADEIA